MESHGKSGNVQVSHSTYLEASHDFSFEFRGKIRIKGVGRMRTYFVTGELGKSQKSGRSKSADARQVSEIVNSDIEASVRDEKEIMDSTLGALYDSEGFDSRRASLDNESSAASDTNGIQKRTIESTSRPSIALSRANAARQTQDLRKLVLTRNRGLLPPQARPPSSISNGKVGEAGDQLDSDSIHVSMS